MDPKIAEIQKAFGGRIVGNPYVRQMVIIAVSKLPEEHQEKITKNVWFFSSDEDAYGYAFNYTILHEIGHIILNHKNSIGFEQTKEEIRKQESQADQFAKRYPEGD